MIASTCQCGRKFSVSDDMAGKRVRCPQCGDVFRIPDPAAPHVPAAPPPIAADVTRVSHQVRPHHRERKVNAFGVGAFIFGILALMVCWIPLIQILVVPLATIGVLLAVVGLATALIGGRSGFGWPATGLVLCVMAYGAATYLAGQYANAMNRYVKEHEKAAAGRRAVEPK